MKKTELLSRRGVWMKLPKSSSWRAEIYPSAFLRQHRERDTALLALLSLVWRVSRLLVRASSCFWSRANSLFLQSS